MKLKKCVKQLEVLMMERVPERMSKCKYNCSESFRITCENYQPYYPRFEQPVVKGKLAYVLRGERL